MITIEKHHFVKPLKDENDPKEIFEFLKNHFRYDTMNPWNRSTSYAHNVKLHNLDIPEELSEKAWAVICDSDINTDNMWFDINETIREFEIEAKNELGELVTIGFNGRSGGYIVLYQKSKDGGVYVGRGMDEDFEDFEDCYEDELKERYALVKLFDTYCDKIRDIFLNYVQCGDIVEETYVIQQKVRTLQLPE